MVLPDSFRVRKCYRVPIRTAVEVWRRKSGASLSGVCICGSLWTCPVCAARISEHRRVELVGAVERWRGEGGAVALLTLTFPHVQSDLLRDSMPAFADALSRFQKHRTFRDWVDTYGLRHRVRSLEITHGDAHGWHPHAHVLLFLDRPAPEGAAQVLWKAWAAACRLAGLGEPSRERGIDLRDGTYAAAYAAKWGIADEMTKAHVKKGRGASRTPWDLLRTYLDSGDLPSVHLFRAYAEATRGRRQLHWSHGARRALGLDVVELTDEEAAHGEASPDDVLLATITLPEWRAILRTDAVPRLMDLVEDRADADGVIRFVRSLTRGGSFSSGQC